MQRYQSIAGQFSSSSIQSYTVPTAGGRPTLSAKGTVCGAFTMDHSSDAMINRYLSLSLSLSLSLPPSLRECYEPGQVPRANVI